MWRGKVNKANTAVCEGSIRASLRFAVVAEHLEPGYEGRGYVRVEARDGHGCRVRVRAAADRGFAIALGGGERRRGPHL